MSPPPCQARNLKSPRNDTAYGPPEENSSTGPYGFLVRPKPIVTCSRKFSRVSCGLHVIDSSFDWTDCVAYFLIGQGNKLGFGFTKLSQETALSLSCSKGV